MLKKLLITLVVLIIIGLVVLAGINYYYQSLLEPVDPAAGDEFILVEIPSGAGGEVIAEILEQKGLIQNPLAFRYYMRSNNLGHNFIAGIYQLSPSMDVEQITEKLQSGEVYSDTTWFTIPEGYSIEQMAERLEEEYLVEKDIFLELAKNPTPGIIEVLPYLNEIDDSDVKYLLEGYLFPDTYEIEITADETEIIKVMLQRMVNVLTDLTEVESIEQMDRSLHDLLTMASLVEREARVDHERERIAGVFMNRLENDQRLESCATIQYILGETKEFLTTQDLELPSPYNTYQQSGLPPGPIAAPGEKAIDAALNPEAHDYYYFNYKYDDSGEHYFSKTLEEHNQNVRRAEENLD